jgi:predicted site-specific integrase-resolvase
MTRPETREMMSALQVCELLGINLNNLRQITHRGQLKPIKKKVGKYKQYVKADVLLYHAKRELRGMANK